jgi:hypothetical protein
MRAQLTDDCNRPTARPDHIGLKLMQLIRIRNIEGEWEKVI